jgi:imidazolonepropionase-like amidohydrolase
VPFLSVVDSIDPVLDYFEDCRRNGITTTAVVPGNSTMIGGRAAILKSAGGYVNDMLLRRDSALKISLQPVGSSRMSHIARLRAELDKAKRALEAEALGEKAATEEAPSPSDSTAADSTPGGGGDGSQPSQGGEAGAAAEQAAPSPEQANEGLKVLQSLLKGEIPAYIYCETAMDVGQAIRLIDDYKIKPILVLGQDCYKAASLIGERKLTVILDPTLVFWETDPQTRTDKQIVIPKLMVEAQVPFVFQIDSSGTRQTLGSGFLWYQAATSVKYGLPREQALRAVTLTAAELLGVDSFVGSIEPGKDADLVILSGDPLSAATWVERTFVAGEEVYNRSEDRKLKQLLEVPAQ